MKKLLKVTIGSIITVTIFLFTISLLNNHTAYRILNTDADDDDYDCFDVDDLD